MSQRNSPTLAFSASTKDSNTAVGMSYFFKMPCVVVVVVVVVDELVK